MLHEKTYDLIIASALYLLAWSTVMGRAFGSSLVFPLTGNVYPDGNYTVTIQIGDPPLPYTLDIDSGSDLTWVQCDAPCTNCYNGPHPPYQPRKRNLVSCVDPACVSFGVNPSCSADQCDYFVEYADSLSSRGVLVRDSVPATFTNGTPITPRIVFGCGYDQDYNPERVPWNDGMMGLGKGEASFVSQLRSLGVTSNVVGHCLSGDGGGFLFIGDITPVSNVVWKAVLPDSRHYSLGSANMYYDGVPTDIAGLQIVFDSGSTYTYLPDLQYEALLDLINKHLDPRLHKTDDPNLPECWMGDEGPFGNVTDVAEGSYFKNWAFSFGPDVIFQMEEQNFLIVTNLGNVCLGIFNGTDVGLGGMIVIGDISMQDKLVIYDNDLHQVGWAQYYDCTTVPTN